MRVIIAAAGTGGHINPGMAIANKILKENKDSEKAEEISSMYISFLFRCTWELGSKNFIQKSCAQKVEMLYPFETRHF